ncbi:putative transcriptional regulator, partial [Dysosmobacter welbionis]
QRDGHDVQQAAAGGRRLRPRGYRLLRGSDGHRPEDQGGRLQQERFPDPRRQRRQHPVRLPAPPGC